MIKFYLIPIDSIAKPDGGSSRGPKYIAWNPAKYNHPGIVVGRWAMMDYGFSPYALFMADISQADHDLLIQNTDVYTFPDNLDSPVNQDIRPFFESFNLPTDWLTPATTYRELLRNVAGMMQFNQRYNGIWRDTYGANRSIFDTATLDTRLRDMTAEEQSVFLAAVASFGYDPNLVPTNARLRQLVKAAGDYWEGQPFYMGGIEF